MKFNNVRLLKLSLKPCSLFHNFKTRKGDFSNLKNLCLHINVQIKRRKYLREDFFRGNKAFEMIFFASSSEEVLKCETFKTKSKALFTFSQFQITQGRF